jgi:hypothetical protein
MISLGSMNLKSLATGFFLGRSSASGDRNCRQRVALPNLNDGLPAPLLIRPRGRKPPVDLSD